LTPGQSVYTVDSMKSHEQRPDSLYTREEIRFVKGIALILATAAVAFIVGIAAVDRAHAAPLPTADEGMYWLATDYWGGEPVNCRTINLGAATAPLGFSGEAVGEADQPPRRHLPAAQRYGCTLRIAASIEPGSEEACKVMLHEVGHLHGMGHSPDPSNIMFFAVTDRPIAPCSDAARALYADPGYVALRNSLAATRSRCQSLKARPGRATRRVAAARPADRRTAARCWRQVRRLARQASAGKR